MCTLSSGDAGPFPFSPGCAAANHDWPMQHCPIYAKLANFFEIATEYVEKHGRYARIVQSRELVPYFSWVGEPRV